MGQFHSPPPPVVSKGGTMAEFDLLGVCMNIVSVGRDLSLPVELLKGISLCSYSKMKRAGTTGSSRGMALYEEEVRSGAAHAPLALLSKGILS